MSSVSAERLNLTDRLARDRTTLANERTLLAYLRTGLMMIVSGVSLIKLVPEWGSVSLGVGGGFALAGALTFFWGLRRYAQTKNGLTRLASAALAKDSPQKGEPL